MVHFRHCFYCGKTLSRSKATKDHIIPRSKGGGDSQHNIVDACRKCNTEKGNLLLDEYRQVVAFRFSLSASTFRFPGEGDALQQKKEKSSARKPVKKKRLVYLLEEIQEYKEKCFSHYGRVCKCCNVEFDENFLTLDSNDTRNTREEIELYLWAIRNKFPESLETHCWNCSLGKEMNGGCCPHKNLQTTTQ